MPVVSSPEDGLAQIALLREKRADDPRQWVTLADAISLIGKKETAIRELMRDGKLTYKKDGGALRICRDSILAYDIACVMQTYGLKPEKVDGRRAQLAHERKALAEKRARATP
jgi:hypothetical protein